MIFWLKRSKKIFFSSKTRNIRLVLSIFMIVSLIFGLFMYTIENFSLINTYYFILTTATTVGYGDLSPSTTIGKLITPIYMVISISVLGIILGLIGELVMNNIARKRKGLSKMRNEVKLLIVGYPSESKVKTIIEEVRMDETYEKGNIVVISNSLEEAPEWFSDYNITFIKGLASEIEILERAGIKNTDTVVVLAIDPLKIESDDFSSSAVAVMYRLNSKLRIISEKVREDGILFESSGASVIANISTPQLLAQEVLDPGAIEFEKAIFSNDVEGTQYNIEYKGKEQKWIDMVLLFVAAGAVPEGYKYVGQEFVFLPSPGDCIVEGTIIKYRAAKRLNFFEGSLDD